MIHQSNLLKCNKINLEFLEINGTKRPENLNAILNVKHSNVSPEREHGKFIFVTNFDKWKVQK